MTNCVSVHILHDDAALVARWAQALAEVGVQIEGTSRDVDAAPDWCPDRHPDVLLIGTEVRGGALGLVRAATASGWMRCLVIADEPRESQFLAFMCAGASGFVASDSTARAVEDAVRTAADGAQVLSAELICILVEELRRRNRIAALHAAGPLSRLTPREWEVLGLLREGLSTAQIARRLVVSPTTVRGYIASIVRTLHAQDRQEALAIVDRLMAGGATASAAAAEGTEQAFRR